MKKNENKSFVLLSSKRAKADRKSRAVEVFALPVFPETSALVQTEAATDSSQKVALKDDSQKDLDVLKQTMLQHEAMFREQVRELHRLYQVQRSLMAESRTKVLHTLASFPCTDPRYANSSFNYSADPLRYTGARGGLKDRCRLDSNCFAAKSEEIHFPEHQKTATGVTECCDDLIKSKCQRVVRTVFNLELPPEEYLDVEAEEGCTRQGNNLLSVSAHISHDSCSTLLDGQKITEAKCIDSNPNRDSNAVESTTMKSSNNELEDQRQQGPHSCGSREASFGPVIQPKVSVSMKPLFKQLTGFNHENQVNDQLTLGLPGIGNWSSAPEYNKSIANHSSKPAHWLLKDNPTLIKAASDKRMTQALTEHQFLPGFLQKKDAVDLSTSFSGGIRTPVAFHQPEKSGDSWSNDGIKFQLNQVPSTRPQIKHSATINAGLARPFQQGMHSATGCAGSERPFQLGIESVKNILEPLPLKNGSADTFPFFTSNHLSINTQPPTFASEAVKGPMIHPWLQQNSSFSSLTRPLQPSGIVGMPAFINSAAVQLPVGDSNEQPSKQLDSHFRESLGDMLTPAMFSMTRPTVPELSNGKQLADPMVILPETELTLSLSTSNLDGMPSRGSKNDEFTLFRDATMHSKKRHPLFSGADHQQSTSSDSPERETMPSHMSTAERPLHKFHTHLFETFENEEQKSILTQRASRPSVSQDMVRADTMMTKITSYSTIEKNDIDLNKERIALTRNSLNISADGTDELKEGHTKAINKGAAKAELCDKEACRSADRGLIENSCDALESKELLDLNGFSVTGFPRFIKGAFEEACNHHDNALEAKEIEHEVSDHTGQAAEILLSLSDVVSHTDKVPESRQTCMNKSLLEHCSSCKQKVNDVHRPSISQGAQAISHNCGHLDLLQRTGTDMGQSATEPDPYSSVILTLDAGGTVTDKEVLHVFDTGQRSRESSMSLGLPFRKEKPDNGRSQTFAATLSTEEATEDIQITGGRFMDCPTDTSVMKADSAIWCKQDDIPIPEVVRDTNDQKKTPGLSKSSEAESSSSFSWGELTQRRRVRRQRSQWSPLPVHVAVSSP